MTKPAVMLAINVSFRIDVFDMVCPSPLQVRFHLGYLVRIHDLVDVQVEGSNERRSPYSRPREPKIDIAHSGQTCGAA